MSVRESARKIMFLAFVIILKKKFEMMLKNYRQSETKGKNKYQP